MAIIVPPDSPYGRELWRWDHREDETCPTDKTIHGMRPAHKRDYPAKMYRVTGKNPLVYDKTDAADEVSQRNLESRGYVAGGLGAAVAAFDGLVQDAALAAAHRNYEDRNISPAARAEVDAVEQASSRHLGEIPATPIRRRGRRPKGS